MRHVPARSEQTQSSLSDTKAASSRERETLEQRRAELVLALAAAEQSTRTFLPGSLEHGKAKARVTCLQKELRLVRGRLGVKRKRQDLGERLIEIFRERVTSAEWQRIVAEARRRADVQQRLAEGGSAG
jgi:hypothetical protein